MSLTKCCGKPAMRALSHHGDLTHTICGNCGSHQYGFNGGQLISKKDWHEWINDPGINGEYCESYDSFKARTSVTPKTSANVKYQFIEVTNNKEIVK